MMLNNKGQTLVIFVIFIPLFIGMMALVFDIGNVIYEHNIFRTKGYLVKSRYKGYIDSNNKKRLVKLK